MEAESRRAYPYVAERVWWDLRRQFKLAPPRGAVDASYLSTVLKMDQRSARNIIPNLRRVHLIDEGGRATELAIAWRDDLRYREATQEMMAAAYPESLLDAAPAPSPDSETVRRWFARETRSGEGNARRLAAFYELLARGDPSEATDEARRRLAIGRTSGALAKPRLREARIHQGPEREVERHDTEATPRAPAQVAIHIHIDAAATDQQLDRVIGRLEQLLQAE